jgi:hypothetical protein
MIKDKISSVLYYKLVEDFVLIIEIVIQSIDILYGTLV